MATQLPMILDISTRSSNHNDHDIQPSSKKARKPSSFLAGLQFGSLQAAPQPGDVHYPPMGSRQPRPLGLIPNRNNRLAALKKLNQLLSPWSTQPIPTTQPLADIASTRPLSQHQDEGVVPTISASVHHSKAPADGEAANIMEVEPVAYRLALAGSDGVEGDPDYMGDRAREYYALAGTRPLPSVQTSARGLGQSIGHHSNTPHTTHKTDGKITSLKRQPTVQTHANPQYFNFTGQAHLFERPLMEDKRDAVGHELCERCRLRGGRCAHCKALRTGGGYIILDAGQESWMLNKQRKGLDFKWTGAPPPTSMGGGRGGRGGASRQGDMEGTGQRLDGGGAVLGDSRGGASQKWGRGDRGEREGGGAQRSVGDGMRRVETNSGDDRGKLGTQAQNTFSKEKGSTRDGSAGDDTGRKESGHTQGGHSREGQVRGGVALTDTDVERSSSVLSQGGQGDASGRQSQASRSTSRQGWSRPGSTRGARPGSMRQRSGRIMDQNKRSRSDMEGGEGGQGRTRNPRGREGSIDMEGGGTRGRRGKQSADEGNSRGSYEGPEFKFDRNNGEEEDNDGYHGNLMKFKRKKDNVKVLQATLKELQGIDPLDYLAKYCIIDQAKVPHYQHVFTNVDRDEDDEIDIGELDFALKAVNYDLISDSEMSYVHSVLELAGRYKLNFRLFSLIAALSEKVVALEDTVKRLINKMDFDALEVKMKKCKELFYLLADADEITEHDGGVVTSRSLAVELQAGGLTQDHVEFVVDRLNHEGKGLVEFLDYLTYVPLFVEIHDAIYGNPLDFSRTK